MLIVGTDQSETLNGTPGDDEFYPHRGDDVVNGLGGNDVVYWATGALASDSDGNDFVDGGDGIDRFAVLAETTLGVVERPIGTPQTFFTHSYRLAAGANGLATWTMTSVKIGFDFRTETSVMV